MIIALASGNPVNIGYGAVAALVFAAGGVGVRESDWPAAALVFSIYLVNLLYQMASGHLPGILAIIATGMLLANVRAAFIASTWKPGADGEDKPTRFAETFTDKLSDLLPAKAWPILQVPFFGLAAVFLLLSLAGLGLSLLHRSGLTTPVG